MKIITPWPRTRALSRWPVIPAGRRLALLRARSRDMAAVQDDAHAEILGTALVPALRWYPKRAGTCCRASETELVVRGTRACKQRLRPTFRPHHAAHVIQELVVSR